MSWGYLAQGRKSRGLHINQLVISCTIACQGLHIGFSEGLFIGVPEGSVQGFFGLFTSNYIVTQAVGTASIYLVSSADISVDK